MRSADGLGGDLSSFAEGFVQRMAQGGTLLPTIMADALGDAIWEFTLWHDVTGHVCALGEFGWLCPLIRGVAAGRLRQRFAPPSP